MILKDFVTLSEDCVPSATCNLTGSLSQDFLSQHDLNLLGVGYFGCMCVYKESINALLLKESLGAALSFMPWLAGRLTRKVRLTRSWARLRP